MGEAARNQRWKTGEITSSAEPPLGALPSGTLVCFVFLSSDLVFSENKDFCAALDLEMEKPWSLCWGLISMALHDEYG